MATDLTKVQDHPVTLLRKKAQERHDLLSLGSAKAAFEHAAETLSKHEEEHGVVFAALDKEALARVAEAYADAMKASQGGSWAGIAETGALRSLRRAVPAALPRR